MKFFCPPRMPTAQVEKNGPPGGVQGVAHLGIQRKSYFGRVLGVAAVLLQEINTDFRECLRVKLLVAEGARPSSARFSASVRVNAELEAGGVDRIGKRFDS
jgi:hypothetical protein